MPFINFLLCDSDLIQSGNDYEGIYIGNTGNQGNWGNNDNIGNNANEGISLGRGTRSGRAGMDYMSVDKGLAIMRGLGRR